MLGARHGAAAGLRGEVVLASVVLFLVHPLPTERIHCHMPVHGGFWMYWSFLSALIALRTLVHGSPFSSLYLAFIACSSGVACGVQSLEFREILVLLVRNAWFDSGYKFCGSLGVFWTNYTHFLLRRGLGF